MVRNTADWCSSCALLVRSAAARQDAVVALLGQGQLEGGAGKTQHFAQGLQALLAGRGIGRAALRPHAAVNVRQGLAQRLRGTVQAVHLGKRGVGPEDAAIAIAQHQAAGELVEQGCRIAQGAWGDLGGQAVGRHGAPQPHAAHARERERERGHAQALPAVLEFVGLGLVAVALQARGNVAVNVGLLVRAQAPHVEAAQVGGVRLAHVHMVGVFGEKAQERRVPQQGAVVFVEQAQGYAQAIEHLADGR